MQSNEWYISARNIRHGICNKHGYTNPNSTWNISDVIRPPDLLWCCIRCGEKAPEHLIIQWKLLYGK